MELKLGNGLQWEVWTFILFSSRTILTLSSFFQVLSAHALQQTTQKAWRHHMARRQPKGMVRQ